MKHLLALVALTWALGALSAPNVITVDADPSVAVKVTPRAGNTSKTLTITVNKQDRVVRTDGTLIYPTTGSATISWVAPTTKADGSVPVKVLSYIVRYSPNMIPIDGVTCLECKDVKVMGTKRSVVIDGLDMKRTWTFGVMAVGPDGVPSLMSFFTTKVFP